MCECRLTRHCVSVGFCSLSVPVDLETFERTELGSVVSVLELTMVWMADIDAAELLDSMQIVALFLPLMGSDRSSFLEHIPAPRSHF